MTTIKEETQLIKNAESFLRDAKLLKEDENLHLFLSRQYSVIKNAFNAYFSSLRIEYSPIPNKKSDRLFIYLIILINFYEAISFIENSSEDFLVKANSEKLKKDIHKKIIQDLSPYFVSFLKWDLERRVWKNSEEDYKIKFLEKKVSELDDELQGKGFLVKKYVTLFIDFFISKIDEFLEHIENIDPQELKKSNLNINNALIMRAQLSEAIKNNKINNVVDNKLEISFLDNYKPVAQHYLEGKINNNSKFDYLLYSFIEAQNDYKKFIQNILKSINYDSEYNVINKLKNLFENNDINGVIDILHSIFSSVPNQLIKNTSEAYYHIFIHTIFKLMNVTATSEASTNIGRIDTVVELNNSIYIIEYKLSNSKKALEQIIKNKYHESYLIKNKQIYLLGLSFDQKEKNIRKKFSLKKVIN